MKNNPDSDDVNANTNSNNNNASVNVNNYFDNNKPSNSSIEQLQPIRGDDDEDEDDLDDEGGSGDEAAEDYSDYEEDIEEFTSSSSSETPTPDGVVSVNTTTVNSTRSSLPERGQEEEEENITDETLPSREEHIVQPDQIHNVVADESSPSAGISTATEVTDETSNWPRTEALIGIRPFGHGQNAEEEEEGSGNGRRIHNDDDDDDDYDDEETDIMKARKRVKNARENAEKGSRRFNNYNGNLEDDSDEDGSSRYLKNRRFGKNNAIKFISTPHGKVGILYSSTNDDAKKTNSVSSGSSSGIAADAEGRKDMFRGISSELRPILISNPDARSNEDREGSSSGKMTPVLTADGKVALLYRGASAENDNVAKKYEPIVNYTKPAVTSAPQTPQEDSDDDDDEEDRPDTRHLEQTTQREHKDYFHNRPPFENDFSLRPPPYPSHGQRVNADKSHHNSVGKEVESGERGQEDAHVPPPPPKIEDNNFLPILDRPLSELLGLKKHQFTHFRVTEPAPTTAIPQVNMRGKLPSNFDYDFVGDYNGVSDQEILTKTEVVNLAIVPSVTQERNSVVHHKGNAHFRKHRPFRFEDLSNIHCAMQFVVGVAALCCIFGMVGAYFRNRFLDTQVPTYRL